MSKPEVIKVDRPNGTAVSVTQMIGNICIEWGRGKNRELIELSRVKPGVRIYDPAQREISKKVYKDARKQVRAILFPKSPETKSKRKPQPQLTLF